MQNNAALTERQGRFAFKWEFRPSEVIQIALLIVALSAWAVRTEGKIEKVAADGRTNTEMIREVSENNRETARIIATVQEQITKARLAIAANHGMETLR